MIKNVTLKSLKEEVDSLEHFVENTSSELDNALIRMGEVSGMVEKLIKQEVELEAKKGLKSNVKRIFKKWGYGKNE